MGKRQASKRYEVVFEKLIGVFNDEFVKLQLPQRNTQNVSPPLTKITKLLEKIENKKRSRQVASKFKNYLEKVEVNNGMEAAFIRGLLHKINPLTEEKEKKQSLYSRRNSVDSAKEALVIGRQIVQGSFSLLNTLGSSAKAFVIFSMYALANRPVEGMRLIAKRNTPYLQQIEQLDKSQWYRLYDASEKMMNDFSKRKANQLDTKTQHTFFEFLKYALDAGIKNSLSEQTKETFFDTTEHLLKKDYNLNDINTIKYLYNLFNVFLRLDLPKKHADAILTQVGNYAKLFLKENNSLAIDKDERTFTEFFWILNITFDWYAEKLDERRFILLFNELIAFNYRIIQWDKDSLFLFRMVLTVYSRLRKVFQKNPAICSRIDQAASSFVEYMLLSPLVAESEDALKETVYIGYISKLPKSVEADGLFSEKYTVVREEDVFPEKYRAALDFKSGIKIECFLQQPLSQEEYNIVEEVINNTRDRVKSFKEKMGLHVYEEITAEGKVYTKSFKLYIFNSNAAYVRYGDIWGIGTGGGGYTQVRLPQKQPLPYYTDINPKKWYEAFVYKQPEGDSRDGENKEGRGFRNLGHEIQHKLFYDLIGHRQLHNLPSWFIEGSANALGNEACFKEEANYIEQRADNLPSIQNIIAMSYSNGADHYYFGSALMRFMLEKYPQKIAEIVKAAQKNENIDKIKTLITEWASVVTRENEFKVWLKNITQSCSSEKNRRLGQPVEVSDLVTQASRGRITRGFKNGHPVSAVKTETTTPSVLLETKAIIKSIASYEFRSKADIIDSIFSLKTGAIDEKVEASEREAFLAWKTDIAHEKVKLHSTTVEAGTTMPSLVSEGSIAMGTTLLTSVIAGLVNSSLQTSPQQRTTGAITVNLENSTLPTSLKPEKNEQASWLWIPGLFVMLAVTFTGVFLAVRGAYKNRLGATRDPQIPSPEERLPFLFEKELNGASAQKLTEILPSTSKDDSALEPSQTGNSYEFQFLTLPRVKQFKKNEINPSLAISPDQEKSEELDNLKLAI